MILLDPQNALTIAAGLAPAAVTADGNGSAIDLRGYIGRVMCLLFCKSASAGTNPTMDVTIETSADGSTGWTAVSGAAFTRVTDAADSLEAISVEVRAVERYIRFAKDIGGTSSPSFTMAALIAGQKQY